jgi:hypothetical protein
MRIRSASDARRNSFPSASKLQGAALVLDLEAGVRLSVEDLLADMARVVSVGQRGRLHAMPLGLHHRDRAVGPDTMNTRAGRDVRDARRPRRPVAGCSRRLDLSRLGCLTRESKLSVDAPGRHVGLFQTARSSRSTTAILVSNCISGYVRDARAALISASRACACRVETRFPLRS